jgi:hypothetical protein
MHRMRTFRIAAIILSMSFGMAAIPTTQSDIPSAHLDGKVKGIILNWACEPMANAQITFTHKKRTQLITPDRNGHFIVDLPAGDYWVSVFMPNLGRVKSSALSVQRGKNGELHLFVNTGVESTCPCFGPDIEDMLIPVEPVIINTQIQERKLIPQP